MHGWWGTTNSITNGMVTGLYPWPSGRRFRLARLCLECLGGVRVCVKLIARASSDALPCQPFWVDPTGPSVWSIVSRVVFQRTTCPFDLVKKRLFASNLWLVMWTPRSQSGTPNIGFENIKILPTVSQTGSRQKELGWRQTSPTLALEHTFTYATHHTIQPQHTCTRRRNINTHARALWPHTGAGSHNHFVCACVCVMYCVRLCGIVWFCDCVLRIPCLCVWCAVLCDDVSVCVFLLLYWVLKASTDGLCASVCVWADHLWCQCLCASQGYFSFYLCFVFSSCFVLYQCGDACVCVCLFCVHCVGLCARPINTHYQTHKYKTIFVSAAFLFWKSKCPHLMINHSQPNGLIDE